MLEINYTLFFQVATFLLILFFLNIFLYNPIRKILTQREKQKDALTQDIGDLQAQCEKDAKSVEDGMVLARKEGYLEKERLKVRAVGQEKTILQETGSLVEQKRTVAREETESKIVDARKVLEAELSGFSKDLAQKILGRSVA